MDRLLSLPDDVLALLCDALDVNARLCLAATSAGLSAALSSAERWRCLSAASTPHALVRGLKRSKGQALAVEFAGSESAQATQTERRFQKGMRLSCFVPFTRGLRALALAALMPSLQRLVLDEGASPIGGMTNDFAVALASSAPGLRELEVSFSRTLGSPCRSASPSSSSSPAISYRAPSHSSLPRPSGGGFRISTVSSGGSGGNYIPGAQNPSELFTDEGLIHLAERCTHLASVSLVNCGGISDRSLYALAFYCRGLVSFHVGGYSERITDAGLTVLFNSCHHLRAVRLSSKLLKATDSCVAALAGSCRHVHHVKLTRAMTDAALLALLAMAGAGADAGAGAGAGTGHSGHSDSSAWLGGPAPTAYVGSAASAGAGGEERVLINARKGQFTEDGVRRALACWQVQAAARAAPTQVELMLPRDLCAALCAGGFCDAVDGSSSGSDDSRGCSPSAASPSSAPASPSYAAAPPAEPSLFKCIGMAQGPGYPRAVLPLLHAC